MNAFNISVRRGPSNVWSAPKGKDGDNEGMCIIPVLSDTKRYLYPASRTPWSVLILYYITKTVVVSSLRNVLRDVHTRLGQLGSVEKQLLNQSDVAGHITTIFDLHTAVFTQKKCARVGKIIFLKV